MPDVGYDLNFPALAAIIPVAYKKDTWNQIWGATHVQL